MATELREDLINLIEVMTRETHSIGMKCLMVARRETHLRLLEPEGERDLMLLYNKTLEEASERCGAIVRMAAERMNELAVVEKVEE